jgi:hypothetical protein
MRTHRINTRTHEGEATPSLSGLCWKWERPLLRGAPLPDCGFSEFLTNRTVLSVLGRIRRLRLSLILFALSEDHEECGTWQVNTEGVAVISGALAHCGDERVLSCDEVDSAHGSELSINNCEARRIP